MWWQSSSTRHPLVGVAVASLVLIVSGCGTRVSQSDRGSLSPIRSERTESEPAPLSSTPASQANPDSSVGENTIAGPPSTTENQSAAGAPRSSAAVPSAGMANTGGVGSAGAATPGHASGGIAPRSGGHSPSGSLTPSTVAVKSVVKLGNVGTYSGPVGASSGAHRQGIQLWAKWVNAKGGVNGHPVELVIVEDGGDAARHKAAVQDLVENHHVLAFIHMGNPISGQSAVPYLESKRVPVIGLLTAEPWAYDSPMLFPQASSGLALTETMFGSWAAQAIPQGKRKLGVIACSEVPVCRDWHDNAERYAGKRGLQVVYKARIGLAQPDFTAECLAASNAGVEIFFVGADQNTLRRATSSCVRQGFHPLFASGGPALVDDLKNEPNFSNSFVAGFNTFPYFQPDIDAAAEFQSATKRFGVRPSGGAALGWVSGKLFEKAAAKLPEPPTTAAVLAGLWSVKDDDLGGLTQPLTFTEDQKPAVKVCWWNVTIRDGAWISPDGYRRTCD